MSGRPTGLAPGHGAGYTVTHTAGPEVVYTENLRSGTHLEAPEDLKTFSAVFEDLIAAAADPSDSRDLLDTPARQRERPEGEE
ncbi:hypothetical protein GCM10022243_41430 [Saccharothrix violaceirubra]|uniref:DUF5753 domain-containing protein n=1 Tax=Saccharothrix violaceirubra TaxID=413306 RepID=A0A7W7T8A0_9PSEU|nr:Scr1 family TA system antitoxin-like transcriptional regulator [Saccharothrix violaceirubra]MBB4968399.1 hypothetical protein [Saccharothrix violaceirubra]